MSDDTPTSAAPAPYDSTNDTLAHIEQVSNRLSAVAAEMIRRGRTHDQSKLEKEEKPFFDEATPRLKSLVYGSPEYRESLRMIKPALEHHYRMNSHHPEFYPNGINGMDLIDLIEMYCDWAAAVLRSADGDLDKSLETNIERFKVGGQLASILRNTHARYNGFCGFNRVRIARAKVPPPSSDPQASTTVVRDHLSDGRDENAIFIVRQPVPNGVLKMPSAAYAHMAAVDKSK